MSDAQRIHDFFVGTGTDHAGRTIFDYHRMDNTTLELLHDYIQWAFPTREASQFNEHAPLLDNEAVFFLQNDTARALDNYYTMLYRMLKFYAQTKHWLTDFDHNHLRITRIIHSSAEVLGLGSPEYFLDDILRLNRDAANPVGIDSINFWKKALSDAQKKNRLDRDR